jgi:hypothetical protein
MVMAGTHAIQSVIMTPHGKKLQLAANVFHLIITMLTQFPARAINSA